MKTNRLELRERTSRLEQWLLEQPIEQQLKFLGYNNMELLEIELVRIKKANAKGYTDLKKWDLILKESNTTIGNCGFHNWISKHERAEMGYILFEDYRGKGYMNEALTSIINYGFHEMNLNRIEAFISPDNSPSINLIERLNFECEGKLREHHKSEDQIHDSLVYGLLKKDYTK